MPVVYRGPYEYSLPGADEDYILQTEPDEKAEPAERSVETRKHARGQGRWRVMQQRSVLPGRQPEIALEGVYTKKLGMWIFLLSEVMFFTSLIGAYVILRFANPEHFALPGEVLNVPLTAINTFVLICSSVSMVKAFAALQNGDQKGLSALASGHDRTWVGPSVGVQIYEYVQLAAHEGFVPSADLYAAEGGPLLRIDLLCHDRLPRHARDARRARAHIRPDAGRERVRIPRKMSAASRSSACIGISLTSYGSCSSRSYTSSEGRRQ